MQLLDILGDLAATRKQIGARAGEMPVVLLMPNGERFEVQSGGWTMDGSTSFMNDAGKYDTRQHIVLTIHQAHPPGKPGQPNTLQEGHLDGQ